MSSPKVVPGSHVLPRAIGVTLVLFGAYIGAVRWRVGAIRRFENGRLDVFEPTAQPPQRRDTIIIITDNPFVMTGIPDARREELEMSVGMNLASPYVSELHLLNQAHNTSFYPTNKLRVYDLGRRSTFLDAIRYANAVLPAKSAFAIANADIVFRHDSVRLLTRIRNEHAVVALSRHDVGSNGSAQVCDSPQLSQDAWIMRTPFPEHPGFDFPLGTLGSDNKAAYLFQELDLHVHNWPFDVIVWHYHTSQHRGAKPRLPLPYASVEAYRANLSSFVFSWQRRHLKLQPNRHVQVISTDLPRFSDAPMQTSIVSNTSTECTDSVQLRRLVVRALDVATRHRRWAHSSAHHASASAPISQFLDLPWQTLAREPAVFETAELLDGIQNTFVPQIALESMFAVVPEDLAPVICAKRSEAWGKVSIVTQDSAQMFMHPLVCPQY